LSEEGYGGGTNGLIAGFGSYWGMANTDFASGFNPSIRQLRRIVEASQYPTFSSIASIQTQVSPNGKWIINYGVNSNCGVMVIYPVDKASSPKWLATFGPSSVCSYDSYYGAYGTFSPDSTKVIFGSSYQLPNRDILKSSGKPDIYMVVSQRPTPPTNLAVVNNQLTWKPAFNHREIKEYEIHSSSSQNGTYQKVATVPALYTYLEAPSKISPSATTINVDSTNGFASSGVIGLSYLRNSQPSSVLYR
jgi:hypothetical protein